jgi:ferredoxin
MTKFYQIKIIHRQAGKEYNLLLPDDNYILQSIERELGEELLPFACRQGACTTCAVRVLRGEIEQSEAMGLSPDLRKRGYALLCVSYPSSDLVVETQDPDEVYELQFGRYFARGKIRYSLPLDEE